MKLKFPHAIVFLILMSIMTGCGPTGYKPVDLRTLYGITTFLSFLFIPSYFIQKKNRNHWYLFLYISIFIVNLGYLTLGNAQTLNNALIYNRIAYLGSVFLPMTMLLIVLDTTKTKYSHWLPKLLLIISIGMFFITASPGYSTIYYKSVELVSRNGVSFLKKIYGPLHILYMLYLFAYFGTMIGVIIHSYKNKTMAATTHAVILTIAVFVNLIVWFIEQLIHIDLELLSVSYVISESFLLSLQFLISENTRLTEQLDQHEQLRNTEAGLSKNPILLSSSRPDPVDPGLIQQFLEGINELTPTEKLIFEAYIARATTKEIRESLCITENTLKFHNKNIYSKLGVSSRKELMELYKHIQ